MIEPLGRALSMFRTGLKLGLPQISTVLDYRIRSSRGWIAANTPTNVTQSIFRVDELANTSPSTEHASLLAQADEIVDGRFRLFSDHPRDLGIQPDWHQHIVSGAHGIVDQPWWKIPDFEARTGDIKGIWELSRFSWAPVLAQAAALTGKSIYCETLKRLVESWVAQNPPFMGSNWKCGQEASFRVLNLLLAARILDQDQKPEPGLVELVQIHLDRISPTILYAMAQDNNHGTSEAAALFLGGAWISVVAHAPDVLESARQAELRGRKWLEDRVQRLVMDDGGFSQYSVTYHRLFVDTMVQAELWRRHLKLAPFSVSFYDKCASAVHWLAAIVNSKNGDAPNLGSNDSANLFRIDGGNARDFRPSVLRSAEVFIRQEVHVESASLQDVEPETRIEFDLKAKRSCVMHDFGLAVINPRQNGSGAYGIMRFPSFRFRPGQADPLHFDLWTDDGQNLLRDSGSFSYADGSASTDFSGISGHNSVQFDGREPMRRLSRFLYGDWLTSEADPLVRHGTQTAAFRARYRDYLGATHERVVSAVENLWTLTDKVSGFSRSATLRWRLMPGAWRLDGNTVTGTGFKITIRSDHPPIRLALGEGWESRDYLSKTKIPMIEAEFGPRTSEIVTEIVLTTV